MEEPPPSQGGERAVLVRFERGGGDGEAVGCSGWQSYSQAENGVVKLPMYYGQILIEQMIDGCKEVVLMKWAGHIAQNSDSGGNSENGDTGQLYAYSHRCLE